MKTVTDCFGLQVRITDERLAHVLEHAEMTGLEEVIAGALQRPAEVRRSRTEEAVRLFYEWQPVTPVGEKWLCVVVKYPRDDAFVVTAYLADKMKAGESLWPTK